MKITELIEKLEATQDKNIGIFVSCVGQGDEDCAFDGEIVSTDIVHAISGTEIYFSISVKQLEE